MDNLINKTSLMNFIKNVKKIKDKREIDFIMIDTYIAGYLKAKEVYKNER